MSGTQSALIGASGGIKPTGLINGASALTGIDTGIGGGANPFTPATPFGAKVVQSGVTVSATLKTILSLSGRGCLSYLWLSQADATSRTHRMKVTMDGVVVFDATSAANTLASRVYGAIGSTFAINSTLPTVQEPLLFDSSLLIEYAGSLSETNGASIAYRYIPR